MKKTVITVLVVIAIVLALAAAGVLGFMWYRDTHIFVDGVAYAKNAQSLDLREEDISFAHYDALHSRLPDCEILWNVPFQGSKFPSDTKGIMLHTLTEEDIRILINYFPDLEGVESLSCDDYAELEMLKAMKPELEVIYEVELGHNSYSPDVTELVLEAGDYDFETMRENLLYLPQVQSILLKTPDLTLDQVRELENAYPDIALSCTVDILGTEYDARTTELDLSAMESGDVADFVEKLPMLPGLTEVNLMDENGQSSLSKEDVKLLQQAAPGVVFHYVFDFYGVTLSTADEEVHIRSKRIGDDGIDEVRAALDIMTNCRRFVLEYCQISYDLLAQVRDEYRDRTKVVWRVEFGGGSCFTDAEVIRCTYDLVDDNCQNLIYCEDVRFMDIGHNEWLDAVPFVAGMPNLEGIIVSGAPIKDLTPFENCRKLKFLEIAFCEYIEDLSPLAGCESLEMLNIGNTHVVDLSPLDDLPLTNLIARVYPSAKCRVPQEEQERFTQQHPDCNIGFTGPQPYGEGWRYADDGVTPLPYYAMLRRVFKYDEATIPNNVGWYLEEGITDLTTE